MIVSKYNTVNTAYAALLQLYQRGRQQWQVWLKRLGLGLVVIWFVVSAWLFTSLNIAIDFNINDGKTIAHRFHMLTNPFSHLAGNEGNLYAMADAAAVRHGIDPSLFRALITQESAWSPHALSHRGAGGLTQLMPLTAKHECGLSFAERFEPMKNLDCGAYYFAKQLKRFGNVQLALCAYNAGPGKVNELGRCPKFPETQNYVTRIMANWNPMEEVEG